MKHKLRSEFLLFEQLLIKFREKTWRNFLGCCFSFLDDFLQLEAVFANLNESQRFFQQLKVFFYTDIESVWAALKMKAHCVEISRLRKWVNLHQVKLAVLLRAPLLSHVIGAENQTCRGPISSSTLFWAIAMVVTRISQKSRQIPMWSHSFPQPVAHRPLHLVLL